MELDQKEKEEEERYNNEFQAQHSIVNKNAMMQKELKRMRKQKDDLIGEVSQIEGHNRKLSEFLVKYARGDHTTPLNIPVLQTFQSTGASKQKESNSAAPESIKNTSAIRVDKTLSMAHGHGHKDHSTAYYNQNYSTSKSLTLKQLKDVID
jgi:hypothetical protein